MILADCVFHFLQWTFHSSSQDFSSLKSKSNCPQNTVLQNFKKKSHNFMSDNFHFFGGQGNYIHSDVCGGMKLPTEYLEYKTKNYAM